MTSIKDQLEALLNAQKEREIEQENRTVVRKSNISTNDLFSNNTIQIVTNFPLWALNEVQKSDAINITLPQLNKHLFIQIFSSDGKSYLEGLINHNETHITYDGDTCISFTSGKIYHPEGGVKFSSHKKVRMG